jgi:hypothetical protein
MKKTVMAIAIVLFCWVQSHAANECSVTGIYRGKLKDGYVSNVQVEIDCVAAVGGAFSALPVTGVSGMITSYMFMPLEGTTPTTAMDMTITDSDGFDLLLGQGIDIDTSAVSKKTPIDSDSKYFPAEFQNGFTVTLTGNSVTAANPKIKINIIP